ncbi:hypothetical protein FW781_15710 [Chryseobacterium panacisoli]|uniref:DKNYY family protein n=1 Tax=Chryseobacterium panacisoli TaxID=1807141 RepID=A0A5D8ZMS5_9FLAO|nr:DKNYY domain-containing protein [Chryseobacterium panacisoli]TZF94074.1 hypothetical protein FW781_15710 [Chryseobacterium panacisoli]
MENSKKIIVSIICLLILFSSISCIKKDRTKEENSKIQNLQKYTQIKDILYRDDEGNIYFKTVSHGDISEGIKPEDIYIDEIALDNGKTEKLKSIIDTISFKRLNYIYYKDNNLVFVENPMAYGSTFSIITGADCKTFKGLGDSYYASDMKNCYYKGNVIKNADSKSFRILEQKDGNGNTSYARDNNAYYNEGKSISYSKIKEYIVE